MCPPSEPIRPLRPISGDLYVGRAELPERVRRRQRREDDEGDGRGGQRGQRDEDMPDATWGPQIDPGTYDDHGRTSATQSEAAPPQVPHIDTSA